jgi:hypothetical protein
VRLVFRDGPKHRRGSPTSQRSHSAEVGRGARARPRRFGKLPNSLRYPSAHARPKRGVAGFQATPFRRMYPIIGWKGCSRHGSGYRPGYLRLACSARSRFGRCRDLSLPSYVLRSSPLEGIDQSTFSNKPRMERAYFFRWLSPRISSRLLHRKCSTRLPV